MHPNITELCHSRIPVRIKPKTEAKALITAITQARLTAAKAAYTTRSIPMEVVSTLIQGDISPSSGDLVLARIDKIGQHTKIELGTGRRAPLFLGDEVVVCYGHRYAPDQFESEVPSDLAPCHLVAAGGIASAMLSRHSKKKMPTRITPLGLLGNSNGQVINLSDWALPEIKPCQTLPLTVASVGTTMNAGKTTSAAYLIKGLVNAGLKVGAAKLTGTGAGGDTWLMRDAGASVVYDFTNAGHASTHQLSLNELENITTLLTGHLQAAGMDIIVLEVADGLYQQETAALLKSSAFKNTVDGVMFCAGDAMGAAMGVDWLQRHQLPVFAISGALTASPLACREAEVAGDLPILDLARLASEKIYAEIEQWLGIRAADGAKVLQ